MSALGGRPNTLKDLAKDDRGAVMVIGLFMAMFLIGAMWTVVGIGDALVYRDKTQELADHLAFTSATVQARGMNFIAAINVIMLCVVAVYMVIDIVDRVLQAMQIASVPPCDSINPATSELGCAVQTYATQSETAWHPWRESYYNGMKPWLVGMSWTQTSSAILTPYAGTAASLEIANEYKESGLAISLSMIPTDGLTGGFANGSYDWGAVLNGNHDPTGSGSGSTFSYSQLDTRLGLPVKNEAMGQLCVYAGDQVLEWIEGWLNRVPVVGQIAQLPGVQQAINRAITAALKGGSCSDQFWNRDGPKAPYLGQTAADGASDFHQVYGLVFATQHDVSTNKVALGMGPKHGFGKANHDEQRIYQAQAEIFYDCEAEWNTAECNRPGYDTYMLPHAMYNMRWMARLRRVHWPSLSGIATQMFVTGALQGALGPLQGKIQNTGAYQKVSGAIGGYAQKLGGNFGGDLAQQVFGDVSDQALHSIYGRITSIFPAGKVTPPTSTIIH